MLSCRPSNKRVTKRILSFYWKHFIAKKALLCNVMDKCAIQQNNKAAGHSKLLRWLDQHSREHNVRSSNSSSDAKLKLKSGQERERNKNIQKTIAAISWAEYFYWRKLREVCRKFFIFSSLCAFSPPSLIIGASSFSLRKLLQIYKK